MRTSNSGDVMANSDYYRRQADVCLQLALVQRDQGAAIWLVEFAEQLMTKAEETAGVKSISPAEVASAAPNEAATAGL